ncbi:MAG TPA: DUF2252 family protein, partial [Polyangiaceae bacterium]|nr:DUF2252 family protein [Polyangiaceae bacterium]
MEKLDPRALALRQVELDARRTCEFAEVLSRKRARMRASPLAFLRGSATLYYEMLRARGELESGPSGTSQLVGDAHLENFGAFTPARAPGAPEEKRPVTFDLNDFDESLQGPVHWDVCRLTTSLIAGGRELGVDGGQVLQLSRCLLDSYVHTAFDGQPAPEPPRPVRALCEQVQKRSRSDLLDDRTTVESGHRRFRLGPRYLALPAEYSAQLPGALLRYASTLRDWERPRPDQLAIVDAAFRVAGTGSLGALRIA